MKDELARISAKIEALETVLIELAREAVQRDPDLYKSIVQRLNRAIIETDAAKDITTEDPDKPVSAEAKVLKTLRMEIKELT